MEREKLHALLRQRPFQPFRVHLKDGRTFEVHFPEINLLGQTYINIGIPAPEDPTNYYDRMVIVPLSLISHLEMFEAVVP